VSTLASQDAEAVVVELPGIDLEPARKVAGCVAATAGKRLVISSPEEIRASCPIRIQGKHLLFLGDVLESTLDEDGQWSVHVSVKSKFMIF